MSRLFDLVRLNLTGSVGAGRLKKLLKACNSTEKIFKLSTEKLCGICGVSARTASKILSDKYRGWATTEMKKSEKLGINLVAYGTPEYPSTLSEIHDPPAVLYVRGQIETLDTTAVAIVGTRRCTRYGRETAKRIAGELTAVGIVVTSGLALGIDTEAHTGTIEASGRTVAVLGTGVDAIYPSENIKLAEKIVKSGALVSEFPLGTKPRRENFPRRNRIISGLSRGVLVVEAPLRSGALITARTATEQGREVFAIPGRIDNPVAEGANSLISDGAKLTRSAAEILEEIAPQLVGRLFAPMSEKQDPVAVNLQEKEEIVYKVLEKDPVTLDTIVSETGLEPAEVSGALLKLQLKQLVEQLPGSRFSRK